jgi:hypothetical protein
MALRAVRGFIPFQSDQQQKISKEATKREQESSALSLISIELWIAANNNCPVLCFSLYIHQHKRDRIG